MSAKELRVNSLSWPRRVSWSHFFTSFFQRFHVGLEAVVKGAANVAMEAAR